MHLIHVGVIIQAPDYLTPEHARDVLAQTLADAKAMAQDRFKLGAIDDQAVMLHYSDFLVTEESPAKRRLDWLLAHRDAEITGSDNVGWIIWLRQGGKPVQIGAGRTAYAAIDNAITTSKEIS